MMPDGDYLRALFGLEGKAVAITGGAGALCSAIARGFAEAGARVGLLDIAYDRAEAIAQRIRAAGGAAIALECNVFERASIERALDAMVREFGRVDVLVNGAGGNRPEATTGPGRPFFDLPEDAIRWVLELNFISAFSCSQVFGKHMAGNGHGVILNITSMNAFRPLTRIPAYSAAKAALANFTQWLAVHMAQEYSPRIRVNAIAPGFFVTDQNRFLLLEESGRLTPRGEAIIAHTPMGRFGQPDDLVGAALWLASEAASFITGAVIPVDGGFSAYAGV